MKNKATDKELGELHALVAKGFKQGLANSERAVRLLAEHGDELPDEVKAFLVDQMETSPSLLTAATKFLKDNDITCVIEDNAELSDLQKTLEAKRKRKQVGNVIPIIDEE